MIAGGIAVTFCAEKSRLEQRVLFLYEKSYDRGAIGLFVYFCEKMRGLMVKKVRDVSFFDIVNGIDMRVSRNEDLAMFDFGNRDFQKVKEELALKYGPDEDIHFRNRSNGQFCCMLEGAMSLEINGRRYDLRAGEVCCMLEDDCYRLFDTSEDARWFVIVNRAGGYMMQGVNSALLLMSFKTKIDSKRSFRMREKTAGLISVLYGLMRETLDDEAFSYKDNIVKSYMHIMFYYLCSDFLTEDSLVEVRPPSRQDELLLQFTRLVSENYKEHRKVSYYADKLCLTPKYLSTTIYEAGGRYARDIIAEFVVCEAKRCLLNTTMTVQEISDYLHFSCQSFFGKYFREHTGVSPQAYRQSPF